MVESITKRIETLTARLEITQNFGGEIWPLLNGQIREEIAFLESLLEGNVTYVD